MTLADLRSLLALAHGPAVERLEDRTPEGVARAYLPARIASRFPADCRFKRLRGVAVVDDNLVAMLTDGSVDECEIDMSDPAVVFGVRAALALALGLDPGPMGCAVSWRQDATGHRLDGATSRMGQRATVWLVPFEPGADLASYDHDGALWVYAPTVASEPDAVKALVLAVNAVLQAPAK